MNDEVHRFLQLLKNDSVVNLTEDQEAHMFILDESEDEAKLFTRPSSEPEQEGQRDIFCCRCNEAIIYPNEPAGDKDGNGYCAKCWNEKPQQQEGQERYKCYPGGNLVKEDGELIALTTSPRKAEIICKALNTQGGITISRECAEDLVDLTYESEYDGRMYTRCAYCNIYINEGASHEEGCSNTELKAALGDSK